VGMIHPPAARIYT